MSSDRVVRVVVGEAAGPNQASLRSVLEGEGFDVVGYAASEAGLEAVLAGVRPEAIVLDAHIGVRSLLAARELAPSAKIVVVWPPGVSAAIADEHVEPSRVEAELANAVRRAALRVLPLAIRRTPAGAEPEDWEWPAPSSGWERRRARRGRVIALAAASLLLVSAAAFAFTAPHRTDAGTQTHRAPHRTSEPTSSVRKHTDRAEGGSADASCALPASSHGAPAADHSPHHANNGHQYANGEGPSSSCHPHGNANPHGNSGHHEHPSGAGHGGDHGSGGSHGKPPPRPTPTDHPSHP